jgi:hypothetical protein
VIAGVPGRCVASVCVSAKARLIEHRDERRAAAVTLAKIRDLDREPLALGGRLGGAAGVLEHRDGPGVRPAASLDQQLIHDEHVPGQRLIRPLRLTGFGKTQTLRQPRIPVGVLVGDAPSLIDLALIEQRVDEPPRSRSRNATRASSRSISHAPTASAARRKRE